MSFLAWIVVGIIAGWLAERIAGRSHGLLTNLFVGIIGALLGGFIFSSLWASATTRASTCPRLSWPRSALSCCLRSLAASGPAAPGPERRYLFAAVRIPIFAIRGEA